MQTLLKLGAPIAALVTHRDDPHEEIWWPSCAKLADQHGIATCYGDKIDSAWTGRIVELQPAVIYSFAYRSLLPEQLLQAARLGAYNVHPSLLPAYRGRAPVNWVLVNGEQETGITLHHMVARADAGDIVGQRKVGIDDSDTAATLYRKLVPLGAELVREFHPKILAGTAPRTPQDLKAGSYFGRRTPDDGRIDWSWPARRVFNLVRAVTHPYPGAFCSIAGRRLFIWEVRVAYELEPRGAPGEIVNEDAGGALEVAAGRGSVLVLRAQFEGSPETQARRVLGAELLRGTTLLS